MTRSAKISKLANAIRRYRGAYLANSKQWVRGPQRDQLYNVLAWAERLQLDLGEVVARIDSFKNYDEFNAWLGGLEPQRHGDTEKTGRGL